MPVRRTGHFRERRGNRDGLGADLRQSPEQRRKPEIVADRQPDSAERSIGRHGVRARKDNGALAIDFLFRQVHVEEMDLVVAGADLPLDVDDVRPVEDFSAARCHRDGTDQQPYGLLGREPTQPGKDRMGLLWRGGRNEPPFFSSKPAAVFRKQNELRASLGSLAAQPQGFVQSGVEIRFRARLDA